jgi:methionyl-tRNA formyltransferase
MIVAAYGLILPQWVLDLPPRGCINIHGSLLPRWRGAAPIHRAIEAGDTQTGITIMQMDAGLDTGDMLLAEVIDIRPDDTTASLHDHLAMLGGRLVVQALDLAARGGLHRTPQPAEGVTYAQKIEKAEGLIDWTQPAMFIERRIRAFNPFPGANTTLGGEAVKVWRAALAEGRGNPGEVIEAADDALTVACGENALRLLELQRPGGKRVPARQFMQGRPDLKGVWLGAPV